MGYHNIQCQQTGCGNTIRDYVFISVNLVDTPQSMRCKYCCKTTHFVMRSCNKCRKNYFYSRPDPFRNPSTFTCFCGDTSKTNLILQGEAVEPIQRKRLVWWDVIRKLYLTDNKVKYIYNQKATCPECTVAYVGS